MRQYRLWLQHRAIDQNLREQYTTYTQELSEIDEQIARMEKILMPTNNALIAMLMQQIKPQEHATSQIAETTGAQPEQNGAVPENANAPQYQTPPPSNYGQQGQEQPTIDPWWLPQPPRVSPPLLAWSNLPNFATQDTHLPEDILSADAIPALPEATGQLIPSNLKPLFGQKPLESGLPALPWWLRDLMKTTSEEQEQQQIVPIDQQSISSDQHAERKFARPTRLVHYDK